MKTKDVDAMVAAVEARKHRWRKLAKQVLLARPGDVPESTRDLADAFDSVDSLQQLTRGANERMSVELGVYQEWEASLFDRLVHGSVDHRRWLKEEIDRLSAERRATTAQRLAQRLETGPDAWARGHE